MQHDCSKNYITIPKRAVFNCPNDKFVHRKVNGSMQDIEALDSAAKKELARIAELPDISLKEKKLIPPQYAAELDPLSRRATMEEANLGFTEAQARVEAYRCMKCKKPACTAACPIGMPIPQYLEHVARGDFQAAIDLIRQTSLIPSICSRVCPHERQCQSNCAMGKLLKDADKGIHMGNMERFCADYERENLGGKKALPVAPDTGKKIAVIGAGPAGLGAAIDLRMRGHKVVIFDEYDQLGGVLRYGIPEFRLPKKILDYELSILPDMGIETHSKVHIGKEISVNDLIAQGFDAVFIGNGANEPVVPGIPGKNLGGIFTAKDYLKKANRGEPLDSKKNVVVIGGGNVAMDAARMAFREGAETVRLIYRRTVKEMPACWTEIHEATAEGVQVLELRSPAEFIADENGNVKQARLDIFTLGEPDANGRPTPVKVEGASETIDCDTVIFAVGNKVSSEILDSVVGEEVKKKVYVGGDALYGPKTVVLALRTGREIAAKIHQDLCGDQKLS